MQRQQQAASHHSNMWKQSATVYMLSNMPYACLLAKHSSGCLQSGFEGSCLSRTPLCGYDMVRINRNCLSVPRTHHMLRLLTAGAYLAQAPTADGFQLKITSQFLVPLHGGDGTLTISIPEINLTKGQDVEFTANTDNNADIFEVNSVLNIKKEDIQLWWPAGGNYGPHKLYNVTIDFAPSGAACKSSNMQSGGSASSNPGAAAAGSPASAHKPFDVNLDLSNGFNLGVNVGDLVDFDLNLPFLGPIFGGQQTPPAAANPANPSNTAILSISQCSFLQKRIGFRTVELVQEPLPQAIKSLFGNNTGFNFSQNKVMIDGILSKEGWQWAMNEKGDWTMFQGNDPNVSNSVILGYLPSQIHRPGSGVPDRRPSLMH